MMMDTVAPSAMPPMRDLAMRDGRQSMRNASFGTALLVPHAAFCDGRTQYHPLSAAIAKNRMGNASVCTQRRRVVKVNVLSGLCTIPTWN